MEHGKNLTWNELAEEYDKQHSGRKARTLPLDCVFKWAEKQINTFIVYADGSIHKLIN